MANFFDQFDEASKSGNFFDQFDDRTPKREESGFLRQFADVPLSVGKGALAGVRMVADAFGAGSRASEAIKGAEGYVASLMSAQAKNDEQEIARIMKDAEDKGVLDQVQAAFKAFSVAPVDLLSQGVGTAGVGLLSMLGGKVLGVGRLGLGAISAATGAGMGAGSAKGSIYEEVKSALLDAKVDEAKAEAAAIKAQEYGGKNLDQILLSAGIGAISGGTGVESVAKRILSRAAAKEVGEQVAKGALREVGEGALKTAAAEGLPEYIQGSQEQLSKNIALQREGFDVPTMRGVVGSGVLEGLAGAGLGAIAGGTEAGLRRQARDQAQRILAEEEKQRIAQEAQAEQQRIAAERAAEEAKPPLMLGVSEPFAPVVFPDGSVATTPEDVVRYEEEQFRKKYAPQPVERPEPIGASITQTDRAALLDGEDPLAATMRSRREQQEAKAEIPASGPWEFLFLQRERLRSEPKTKERDAMISRLDDEIMRLGVQAIEQARKDREMSAQSAFGGEELPSPITREQLMAPKVEPFAPATTTPRAALLGAAPEAGGLRDVLAARRPEPAEVPLTEDYAFLTREKARLIQLPKTPENTATIQRIDEEIRRMDRQAIERRRRDAEAAKTSVFAQEQLPPVESRGAVVAERDLQEMQAKEGSPELTDFELQQAKRTARMAGKPAPATESDLELKEKQKELMALEAERNKIKTGGNLYKMLEGQLDPSDVSDISKDIKKLYGKGYKPLAKQQGQGTFISELVSDGILNNFLPPNMRPGSSAFDLQNSTEFIKDKLRNKDTRSYDAQMQGRELDARIEQLRNEVEGPARVQAEVAGIEPGEAAAIERTAGDAEVLEVLPDLENLRYQRAETAGKGLGKTRVQSIVDAIKSVWKNAPEVVVAENMDDPAIPAEVREHNRAAMQKGATGSPRGFFYKGKAYVLADAAVSPTQVMETLFHEALGHYGLRGTFGPEMEAILKDVVKYRRAEVEAKARQYGLDPKSEKDMLEAAEEVLAEIAQTKPGLSFVKRAIAVIRNFLRDLGLPFKMSNEDIIEKYILPARAFVEKGGSKAVEGKPAASREEVRYQREGEERVKEPKRNILGNPVLGSWTMPTDTKLAGTEFGKDDLIYSLQDKQVDIKRVVQNITETAGRIAAKWNPYLQEELYHGRTARATKEFLQDELRPLIKEIQSNGMTIEEVEKYLHNRHAEDYNKHVAKVNPKNPKMQDGGSGIKTENARAYLESIPADKRKVYEDIAKKVDAITKKTRNLVVESGLEGPDTIAAWEEAFPKYVPLMREESDDFDYTTPAFGVGSGFDVRGKFSRAAMGSERKVANILANIAMQREKAIIKSNKNRVAQAVFGLAAQNPNPDFWMAINPDLAEVRKVDRIKQKIANYMAKKSEPGVTNEELADIKAGLESEYKKLKLAKTEALDAIEKVKQELVDLGIPVETINLLMQEPEQRVLDPKKNEVVSRVNPRLRENDNVLAMRVNGENRYVFFNQNDPRAKRAAQALKNLDADKVGGILKPISVVTRWMASVNTQYNPIFGAYNFLRDVQGAALQLSDTPLRGKQKEVLSGVIPSLKAIYAAMRAERDGKKIDTEMGRLWNEFQEEGGQTGFRDMFSRSQERADALEKEFKQITEGKVKAAGRAVFDWLSDYNDSMENATRLSAYKVAKEKFIKEGMSESEAKQQAASIAKNLTVNFNRKGQIATQAGALYAFFNAAIQGTTRLAQTLRGPAGRKIIAGGLLLGAMQAALLAAAGFDEEEPPEFVRERNIIIPLGGDKYFAFPMPLGYHVIPGFSRIITEWALSGFKDTPERIASLTGMFLEAFNPIGNAGWSVQTLAPTFADPLVALSENKDWTGKPIARKDFSSMDPTPGYTRAKDTASEFSTQIAKFLNYASGGTEFRPGVLSPTPDQIDYLIGQAFGGLGREATKLEQTVLKTATGEELPPYKIPLVGRFYGETKSSAAESNRFYKNLTLLNEHENEIKGRRDKGQPIGDYLKDNPEARLAPMARKTYKDIQQLRKRREQLVERDAPRESVKAVEEQIKRRMATFNERVAQLKD